MVPRKLILVYNILYLSLQFARMKLQYRHFLQFLVVPASINIFENMTVPINTHISIFPRISMMDVVMPSKFLVLMYQAHLITRLYKHITP
jgi:hypothetical protein